MVKVTVIIPAVADKPEFRIDREVSIPTLEEVPMPKEICAIGEEKTIFCPVDGSTIVIARCEKDPVTGRNRFVPTGKTCPLPPVPEVCEIGDEQTVTCPDGTIIVTAKCQKDPVTGRNRWVPTGKPCPPLELPKTVEILTYPKGASLEAFDGQDVTITAAVMCGASPSSGEAATLTVDGTKTAFGTTSGGFVSFKWKATVEPSRTHKICVSVPKSSACPKFGDAADCKIITVSRVIPSVTEQLLKEREAYLSELEAKRKERERIRELVLLATTPILPPITLPVLTFISIPSVPKPAKIPYPVNISIDGVFVGSPPVKEDVDPGIHMILAELKGMAPIYKKVSVKSGDTLTITDIAFAEEPYVPPPITPPVIPPVIPPITPPVIPPITPPTTPGVISIPSIPVPPSVPYPITVEIDGKPAGSPPIDIRVAPGIHNITVSLKGFAPIYRKINIGSGETITLSDISFGTTAPPTPAYGFRIPTLIKTPRGV